MRALAGVYAREIAYVLPLTSREISRWRGRANRIPCSELRAHALSAIDHKRFNIEGAALLAALPRARSPALVRALIACDMIGDFIDTTLERALAEGEADSMSLHQALCDTVAMTPSCGDYYRRHPWTDDGGYMRGLVSVARNGVARLPAIELVRPLAERSARLVARCQTLTHEVDAAVRRPWMEAMSAEGFCRPSGLDDPEWVGAGSSWLTLLGLLAIAADTDLKLLDATRVYQLYYPWASLAATMLDSFADLDEDAISGNQSFLGNYADMPAAVQRMKEVVERTFEEAAEVERGDRHLVVIQSMMAMYLSKDGATAPSRRQTTSDLLARSGWIAQLLAPGMRTMRFARGMRAD